MTIEDVIPLVESLPRHDKLKLIQLISRQLVQDEQIILPTEITERQDALWDIIGMAEGENTDIARRHDEYLYGAAR